MASMEVNNFTHSFIFAFEKDFDYRPCAIWIRKHLFIPIIIGISYVSFVMKGPEFMTKKQPFRLRTFKIVWNISLAILYLIGSFRTLSELFHTVTTHGLHVSVCEVRNFFTNPVTSFWLWVVFWLKLAQGVDAVILVLRKKNIPFIHSYKHFVEMYAVTIPAFEKPSVARWVLATSMLLQGLVNTHLAFRSMDYKVDRRIPMTILGLQVIDKVIGLLTALYAYQVKFTLGCGVAIYILKLFIAWHATSVGVYGLYFYNKYLVPAETPKKTKEN